MRPHAFLARSDHPDYQPFDGEVVLRELFAAVLAKDRPRLAECDVFIGSLLPHEFTARTIGAMRQLTKFGKQAGRRTADDKKFRITLVRRFAIGTNALWSTLDTDDLTITLLNEGVFCVTLTDCGRESREAIDGALRRHGWYMGALEVDLGNPLVRRLCLDLLVYDSHFENGALTLVAELPEDVCDWTGDVPFRNVGAGWRMLPEIPEAPLSAEGLRAEHLLKSRGAITHLERVAEALARPADAEGQSKQGDRSLDQ